LEIFGNVKEDEQRFHEKCHDMGKEAAQGRLSFDPLGADISMTGQHCRVFGVYDFIIVFSASDKHPE